MPSAIAIRMYCVNLLDIFRTPALPTGRIVAGFARHATRFAGMPALHHGVIARSTCDEAIQPLLCSLWIASLALAMTTNGGNAMTDTVNRQILLVEKPTGKLGPEHFKLSK